MADRRFVLTRMHGDGTESPLDWDAPVYKEQITLPVSGPTVIQGSIPAVAMVMAADGLPRYLPYSTGVYVVEYGRVIAGGIITELILRDGVASFVADGFTRYPSDQPHTGSYSVIEKDAAQVYRDLWDHIQGQPGGNIGLSVTGMEESGLLLGKPMIPGWTEAKVDGKWRKMSEVREQVVPDVQVRLAEDLTAKETTVSVNNADKGRLYDRTFPFVMKIGAESVRVTGRSYLDLYVVRGVEGSRATKHYKKTICKASGTDTREIEDKDPEPWKANWYETADLGRTLSSLVSDGQMEFIEEHFLEGDTFRHTVRLGRPIGRRQDGLRFVVGENITEVPEVVQMGDRWASEVLALGSGEGSKTKRATAVRTTDRLRRVHLADDKSAGHDYQVRALARRELAYRSGEAGVTDLTIRNTANAPFGSFGPGDQIRVVTDEGSGSLEMWVRVLSITYTQSDDLAQLVVEKL